MALGPHDFLDVATGIEHDIFKNGAFDTRYTTIPVSIGYDRQRGGPDCQLQKLSAKKFHRFLPGSSRNARWALTV